MLSLHDKDIFILCGGLGKRLRPEVDEVPKVLAEINGRPFLEILLDYLETQGFIRVILGTGYKSELFEEFCRRKKTNLKIEFSKENEPLGTGGAVKNVQPLIKSDFFFALNGDCFCRLDFLDLLKAHIGKKALATLVVAQAKDKQDFGSIALGSSDEITNFSEKTSDSLTKYSSAGIYCFNRDIFNFMPEKKAFSIETEFFPTLVGKDFYGFKTDQEFIDIGTPERYEAAKDFLKER